MQATEEASMDRDEERAGRRESGREDDPRGREGTRDEDELRVQRTEEELRAGTRERQAGEVGVRKSVRTEREQIAVPKKREEVSVDRVPVDDGTPGEIGEDEASMRVVEEEVVVDKQPVVKEEIRIRKDVVEDEEVVEEDVRREEIDVEDATERRRGGDPGLEGRTESGREGDAARPDQPGSRPEDEQRGRREETGSEGFMDKAKRKLQGQ